MDWFQYFMKRKCISLIRLKFDEDMVSLAQVESGSPFANSIWHMDTSSPSELFWNPTCASLNGTSLNPGRLLTWRWRRVHSLGASAVKRLWKNSPLLPFPNLILLVPTVIPTVRFFQFFTWETPSPSPPQTTPLLERGLIVDTFSHQECTIATSRGRPLQLFDNLKCFRFTFWDFWVLPQLPQAHYCFHNQS